jgi:primosomal protein N'
LRYPPIARIALLTVKGRNEEKVRLSAEHVRKELEKLVHQRAAGLQPADETPVGAVATEHAARSAGPQNCQLQTGSTLPDRPADPKLPALERSHHRWSCARAAGPAETYYRYQLMLRTRGMTTLSRFIARLQEAVSLPEDISLAVDIDPVDLA